MSKRVFLTGGAAGIGRATAIRLVNKGFDVIVTDVDTVGLESLAASIDPNAPGRLTIDRLDVTDAQQWSEVLARHCPDGRLDVLVNNAGVLWSGRFEDIDIAKHQRIVHINVTGTTNGCHQAFAYLKNTEGSQVINLCSASALYGQPELASYSASKFAVRGLTEALNLEWRRHGIKVQALWPLFVATAMTDGMDIGSTRRLGVHLTPDDVARAVGFAIKFRWIPVRVHIAVGVPFHILSWLGAISPSWLKRTFVWAATGIG
jgi:NAD(P)-dependent dehydrogenase (short-subunit alcohol dehydrogenase family)